MRSGKSVVLLMIGVLAMSTSPAANALPQQGDRPAGTSPAASRAVDVPAEKRAEVLPAGWQKSRDRAWTTSGDADGFHILAADAAQGYAWRTVATLRENGFDTDRWIGNACVTGSGTKAVVVYAPRSFTNDENLSSRGAFTAIVDLNSGRVDKVKVQSSLAYFNPGCGAGEVATLTQEGADTARTRVFRLDVATKTVSRPIVVPGQLTSAVPVRDGIVAADSHSLVRLRDDGTRSLMAPAATVPFNVVPDAEGGVVFMDLASPTEAVVRRASPTRDARGNTKTVVSTLAKGELQRIDVKRGASGRVFIVGAPGELADLPRPVKHLNVPKHSEVSTHGGMSVTRAARPIDVAAEVVPAADRPVHLDGVVSVTGKAVGFAVTPGANTESPSLSGAQQSPALAGTGVGTASVGSPTDPVDADRSCSVARNDPRNQVLQPKPRQVEWAVDQAVRGALTVTRPANWKNLGMPEYTPQGLFPRPGLRGGGYIPAQIMLGIAAQESNLWQASRAALPGATANPLVGNFYGRAIYNADPSDDWAIRWEKADCGYGVTQVTDGMRREGHARENERLLPYQSQRAVALDFAANIAAGVQILESKWNQLHDAGMLINGGDPKYIENWFFAAWVYNSGFYPNKFDPTVPWGVGWLNNPINPRYPANREAFLERSYDDARTPQYWPYPEKVIGWAGHPIEAVESPNTRVIGYRQAWWLDVSHRIRAKPPITLFCDLTNECHVGQSYVPNYPGDANGEGDVRGEPAGPCAHRVNTGEYDLKCWYHQSATWKPNCSAECGRELLRFDPGYAYQDDGISYPPNCDGGTAPPGSLIIDDVPADVPVVRSGCGRNWTNRGSFSLNFAAGANGLYSSKVDFHQIGGGFGGHFWFGHTRKSSDDGGQMKISGTWTLNQQLSGWARVIVHLPDHGAWTQQARYEINLGNGRVIHRYLPQGRWQNAWVSLGVYPFAGTPSVRLTTTTEDGRGEDDVAWDAIAFQPLPAKPKDIVAVMGDSYISGEGMGDYYRESDNDHGRQEWNACRRSRNSWPRNVRLPGSSTTLGSLADGFSPAVELANVSCSGARTQNLMDTTWNPPTWSNPDDAGLRYQDGQFREIDQVRSGVLNEWTTLVFLSIGGNDEGAFQNAMLACSGPSDDCGRDPEYLPRFKAIIDRTAISVEASIRQIASRAPNATIVLMGYPEILSRTVKCTSSGYFYLTEVAAIGELAEHLSGKQSAAVDKLAGEGVDVVYVDPRAAFAGHGACDSVEWMHAIRLGQNGSGDFHPGDIPGTCVWPDAVNVCLSRESFHPRREAVTGFVPLAEGRLRDIGYGTG